MNNTCKTIPKSLRNNGWKLLMFDRRPKSICIVEAQQNPKRINPEKSSLRYIINKLLKTKDKYKIMKVARENFLNDRFLTINHGGQKEVAQHS